GLPLLTSRGVRLLVARGSIAYSAVTQPLPVFRKNGGTVSSTLAAHRTMVLPALINAEPSAVARYPVLISTGRISSARRLSVRISHHEVHKEHHQNHAGQDQDDARDCPRRRRGSLHLSPCRPEFR